MYPLTSKKGGWAPGGKSREKLRYIRGESFIHRLDPRTKLFLVLFISCSAILSVDVLLSLAIFVILVSLASLSGAFRHWLKMLLRVSPLLILIVVFDSFFSHVTWGPVLFAMDVWIFHPSLTPGSILYGFAMGFRFAAIIGASTLFIMTTKFEDLVAGLRKLGVPYVISFSIGLALRSVTLLSNDMKAIMDAQRSRCMEFGAGLPDYHRLLPLIMPMIICLINRSRNMSSAMLCRGYGYSSRPTLYTSIRMKMADWTVLAMILMIGLAFVYFR